MLGLTSRFKQRSEPDSGVSVVELLIAIPAAMILLVIGFRIFLSQSRTTSRTMVSDAAEDLVSVRLQQISAEIRTSGSNPKFSGLNDKSEDQTFSDENGVYYPFGLNPNPAGDFEALELYRISGLENPPRVYRSGAGDNMVYALEARDPDGKVNDLVRQDSWEEGGVPMNPIVLLLKNIDYIEFQYFNSTTRTVPDGTVRVSPAGKQKSGVLDPNAIRAVNVVISYTDPATEKNKVFLTSVQKLIRPL